MCGAIRHRQETCGLETRDRCTRVQTHTVARVRIRLPLYGMLNESGGMVPVALPGTAPRITSLA